MTGGRRRLTSLTRRSRTSSTSGSNASTAATSYDLRHSFISLLISEGRNIIDVAREAGHSPSMTLDVYGHVIDEFDRSERVSAGAQIRFARDELVPSAFPRRQTAT